MEFAHLQERLGTLSELELRFVESAVWGEPCIVADGTLPLELAADRVVRPEVLEFLVQGGDASHPVHPSGIALFGAWFDDPVVLDGAHLQVRLGLYRCTLSAGLSLQDASSQSINLAGSVIRRAVKADRLRMTGGLFLGPETLVEGGVRLSGASITGSVQCRNSRLHPDDKIGCSLVADGTCIGGSFDFRQCEFDGSIKLVGAEVGGDVYCDDLRIDAPDGMSLDGSRMEVRGSVMLGSGFQALGTVSLFGCRIRGNIECVGGQMDGGRGAALVADGAQVGGRVSLNRGFEARGEVRFLGAAVGGLDLRGAKLVAKPGGTALNGDSLRTETTVFLDEGFSAEGCVRLVGAVIGDSLSCRSATIHGTNRLALLAERMRVGHNVYLDQGCEVAGAIDLRAASIEGKLDFRHASLGGVPLIDLSDANIGRELVLQELAPAPEGTLDLTGATVGRLTDDERSWPAEGQLILDGFRYDSIAASAPQDARSRMRWLLLQPSRHLAGEFRAQPFDQLAAVLRQSGRERAARRVLFEREEQRRKGGLLSGWARLGNWLSGSVVGHGYELWRVRWMILVVMLLGSGVFLVADERGVMMSTSTPEKVRFQPVVYSVDAFVPGLDLHQEKNWLPKADPKYGILFESYLWLHISLGIVLTGLGGAGLFGFGRRE